MPVVIDTNALIFAFSGSPRLTRVAAAAMSNADVERLVSTVSIYEVALKHRSGRLTVSPDEVARGVRASGLRFVAPSAAIMHRAATLDWEVRDPWDRIVAATAIEAAGGRVVTRDRAFDALAAVERIW